MNQTSPALVRVGYILLLTAPITGGVTGLIGAAVAHVYAGQALPPLRQHLRFQYRTFWIGLFYNLIAGVTTLALIGWLLFAVIFIWWVVRCVRGLISLARDRAPDNLTTWGF
ncbi:hypothetical protein CEK62_14920 [Alcanivorax sp. N3-2A]|nr:hypothetical protein CEK62_14920 [Alcanivorax sp. N3-2A]